MILKSKKRNTIYIWMFTIFICVYGYLILKYTDKVSKVTVNTIMRCINVIIPAFFGFMVVSDIIVKSNAYIYISKPFSLISRYILKIPSEYFSVFVISNIGGYPIGVKTISNMVDENKISKIQAQRLICCCFNCSPSFVIAVIGLSVFGNIKIGLYIYLSILISNIIICILTGLKSKVPAKSELSYGVKFNMSILSDCVYSTAKTIFNICIMVLFFAILNTMLYCTGTITLVTDFISRLFSVDINSVGTSIKTIMEISNISAFNKYCYNLIPLITCLLAFGGICVVAQFITICNKRFSLKKFFITRLIHIPLSAILSYILVRMFCRKETVMSSVALYNYKIKSNVSWISVICIVLMVFCVIIKAEKKNSTEV